MKDYKTLTQQGILVISQIKQFKETKKYVSILNMTIGFINDILGILLRTDPNGKNYFSAINLKEKELQDSLSRYMTSNEESIRELEAYFPTAMQLMNEQLIESKGR